jgi:hypothetical protein
MRTRVTLVVVCAVLVAGLLVRLFGPGDPSPLPVRLAEIALCCGSLALAVYWPGRGRGPAAGAQAGSARRTGLGATAWLFAPFVGLALLGLFLSLLSHLCGVLGLPQPLGAATWWLHVGVFVVGLPALFAGGEWASPGRPAWLRRLASGLFVYAFVNFFTFAAMVLLTGWGDGPHSSPLWFRGFSGHWMVFYAMAAAMMCSAPAGGTSEPAPQGPEQPPALPLPRRPPVRVPGATGTRRPADS